MIVAGVGHPSPSDGMDSCWRRRWVMTRADGLGCRESRKPNNTISFFQQDFTSPYPLVQNPSLTGEKLLVSLVCNQEQCSLTLANNKYIAFLLVIESSDRLMHACHLYKDCGLSVQHRKVKTHLVVVDVLSVSSFLPWLLM